MNEQHQHRQAPDEQQRAEVLERRPLAQDRHERGREDHEQHGRRGARVERGHDEQHHERGGTVEQELALDRRRAQPRPHQHVPRVAQVARQEDDDRDLRELGGLERDRAELHVQERAVAPGRAMPGTRGIISSAIPAAAIV